MVKTGEIFVGLVEPLPFLHLLELLSFLIRVVLDDLLNLPDLRSLRFWFIPQKYVNLHLAVVVS